MTPLRAVVVGCGNVGSGYDEGRDGIPPLSHAGAYAADPDIELLGGVDASEAARARFEARWGRPCVASLHEAAERFGTIDVASLSTPPTARLDELRGIADLGCRAVWCEKPMATTAADARALAELAADCTIGVVVNFLRRFDPVHRRVAAMLGGEGPVHVDVRCNGDLANYGSHALDLVRWWLGGATEVAAVGGPGDAVVASIRGPGGTGTVAIVPTAAADVFDVHAWSGARRVALTRNGEVLAVGDPEPSALWPTYRSLGPGSVVDDGGLAAAMGGAVAELVALARHGSPPACGAADGVAALELEELIREAVGAGRKMPVP